MVSDMLFEMFMLVDVMNDESRCGEYWRSFQMMSLGASLQANLCLCSGNLNYVWKPTRNKDTRD